MDSKSFVVSWCRKRNLEARYSVRATGPEHCQQFICEVHIDGVSYVGTGNATTKREAQTNAGKDFINFLVNSGEILAQDVPESIRPKENSGTKPQDNLNKDGDSADQPQIPPSQGEPVQENKEQTSDDPQNPIIQQDDNVESSKNLHGSWTVDNAKSKLHQYFQIHRITASYKYKAGGPDDLRRFGCQMTIHVPELGRQVTGYGTGPNKLMASKSCALSVVQQLYHLGVIDAYSGTMKKDRVMINMTKCFRVAIDPALEEKLQETLEDLGIKAVDVGAASAAQAEGQPGVTLLQVDHAKTMREEKPTPGGVVSWSPPQPNWNTWSSCNIDEGPLATTSLDKISSDLEKHHRNVCKSNTLYQENLREREQLPVYAMKSQIMEAINENPVVIIRGNTGCGKTTQVCQFILDDYIASGQGAWANVCVTQPRRISAVSVAERVAHERCEDLGDSVGYSVRFESVLARPYGSIMFCTVGVLLRKLENGLRGVSHVIVDEVQERDVETDFFMIVLRDMIQKYPDLRIILMSSTVDSTLFVKYFGDCPVVEVSAPSYPVTQYFLEDFIEMTKFTPPPDMRKRHSSGKKIHSYKDDDADYEEEEFDEKDEDLNKNCNLGEGYSATTSEVLAQISEIDLCFELLEYILAYIATLEDKGAILIFLPGWSLISALMKHFAQHKIYGDKSKYVVLPLDSQTPSDEQKKVFVTPPDGITKMILASSIAENCITINDVVYVIDSCKAKMKLFTSHNNMTSYATVWASKTNLEQRKGRAGRVRPGTCFTLCTRARFHKLDEHLTAEMFRTPLHELGLSIKLLRLGAIGHFLSKAPEPPPLDAVIEAEALLRELGCLDAHDALTPLGTILAKLPIEPRLGKMLVLGLVLGVGDTLGALAGCGCVVREVFVSEGRRRAVPQQTALTGDRCSDHVAVLAAFQKWEKERQKGVEAEEEWFKSTNIKRIALLEIAAAKARLINILTKEVGLPEECCKPLDWSAKGPDPTLDLIIALVCMGLYPNVCIHKGKMVLTADGKTALIDKNSVNCRVNAHKLPSRLFVYGEKQRFRVISCKHTTMVAPLHLLLFGCSKVEWVDDVVRLDNWLNLKMSARTAALVTALRPAVERLVERAAADPQAALNFSPVEQKVITCIRELCVMNAGDYNIGKDNFETQPTDEDTFDNELETKRAKTDQNFSKPGNGNSSENVLGENSGNNFGENKMNSEAGSSNKKAKWQRRNKRGYPPVGGRNRGGIEKRGGYINQRGFGNRGGYPNRGFGNQGGYDNRGFGNRGGNRGFGNRGSYGNFISDGVYGNVGYGNDSGYSNNAGYDNDGYGAGYNKSFDYQGGFNSRRGYGNQNQFGNRGGNNYQSGQGNDEWSEGLDEWWKH